MGTFQYVKRVTIAWLGQSSQRHTLRGAVTKAYRTFARQNPQWVAVLFDKHFVFTHMLPLLQKAASTGEKVTPIQVAEIWARQVSMLPTLRQQHTLRMVPAATLFLCMVADELARTQVGRNANLLIEAATATGQQP